jgi:methionine-rich copper-binding protein CopC
MTIRTHFTSLSSSILRLSCSGLLTTLFVLATLLAFPAVASAQALHAEYVSSTPAANAVLKTVPAKITIHFSEELNPTGSNILVFDADHQPVSKDGSVQVDRNDLKTMTVDLQPGTKESEVYVVDWQTVAADDQHHDAGSFRFFVNPSSALTDALHESSTSGTNTTQTNTSSSSGGLPVWSAPLIGVVALLVGGLAGVFFGRKRPQKA